MTNNTENMGADAPLLPGWALLLTVFFTGASVLVIELIGTRVLAPFFGSGIYTWSALIAVTLAALALGYSIGGKLADRSPQASILFYLCLAAGAWTIVTPWLATLALPYLVPGAEIRIVVLASSLLLFFPNLFVLGMACPFAIRLFSRDREASGSTSGRVFAFSTLGSLLAALITGFILVPSYGVLNILTACGGALMLLALFGFLLLKRYAAGAVSLLLACLAMFGALSPAPAEHDSFELVDSSPSYYGHVQVVRRHGLKLLLVNGIMQNQGADEREATLTYLPFFATLPVIRGKRDTTSPRSLVIGLGAGQLPMMLMENGIGVEAVEIDPVIAAMARKHFALDMPEEILHITDGRVFLEQTGHRYDYIYMDAFNADQVPWHL
ncbi:MAG: fused MFS/spermidine synthase, partial [Lysobacterales bacterium]